MFFNKKKKKEDPKPQDPKKLLKERYLSRCQQNTKSILLKLEQKYDESIKLVKEDIHKEEITNRFKKIVHYMQKIDWNSKIDEVMKNTNSEEAATCCLQLSWSSVRDDVNHMIMNLVTFLEGVKQNGK